MKKVFFLFVITHLLSAFAVGQNAQPTTAEDFFAEGLRLLREKSFEPALSSFEKSAALDGKQPATFMNIGSISMILKRYEKAESAFRTAIRLAPTSGAAHSELCAALSLQKKHAAAIEACETGVSLEPDSERTHIARLNAMQYAGRHGVEVLRLADLAMAHFRNSELILLIAADVNILNGNFAYAATLLESLVSMKPDAARYHGMLAEVYLRLARDADSLSEARTAIKLDSQNPYANYAMGLIFFELGQHEEAVESFTKISSDDPRFRYANYYLAVSQSRRGRHEESVRILTPLAEQYPTDYGFLSQLADDLSKVHRHSEAIQAFLKANALQPNNIEILAGLGLSYMALADFEKAILHFEQAFKLKPDDEIIKMFLGVARGRQAGSAQIPSMINDVEANPKNVKKRLELVFILAVTNRIDEAEAHVGEIYRLNPDDPLVYHRIGVAYSEAGRKDKALDASRRSLAKKETPDAHFGLAALLSESGDVDAASAEFARVLELKSNAPGIMAMYGNHLRKNGKRREALEIYKRSLALAPNNAVVVFQAGLLSMKLGDRDAAMAYLGALKSLDRKLARTLERCLASRIWG